MPRKNINELVDYKIQVTYENGPGRVVVSHLLTWLRRFGLVSFKPKKTISKGMVIWPFIMGLLYFPSRKFDLLLARQAKKIRRVTGFPVVITKKWKMAKRDGYMLYITEKWKF